MLALEDDFNRLNQEKQQVEQDYKQRVNANLQMLQQLRVEIDEQSALYDQRRHENCDLNVDLDRQNQAIIERQAEFKRLRHELKQTNDLNQLLESQK